MGFPILIVGLSIGVFFLKLKFAPREIPEGKGYLVWFLSSIQSFVLSLLVGYTIWSKLGHVPQSFSDFISGNLAFTYQAKTSENLGLYAAVFCYILFFVGLSSLYQFTNRVAGSNGTTILAFALFGLIPSAILLGQSLRVPSTSFLLVISGVTIILSILIVITLSVSFNRRILLSDAIRTVGSKLFLSTLFFIMSDISVSLFMSRLGNLGFPIGIISGVCISFLFAYILLGHTFGRNAVLKCVDFSYWVSQLFIPLAFLVLFPPLVNSSGERQITPYFKPIFYLAFGSLIVISYGDLFRRLWLNRTTDQNQFVVTSPWILLAILTFLQSIPMYWPSISSDNFHFGEFGLPFWQLRKFHSLPFIDYQPARGLLNYIPGFFSWLFADSSFGAISTLTLHIRLVYIFFGFFGLRALSGNLGAFLSISSIYLFDGNMAGGLVVAIAALSIICKVSLTRTPLTAIWTWFILMFGVTLFSVAEGALTVLGSIPLFIYLFLEAIRSQRKALLTSIFILLGLIVGLSLFTRVDEMLVSLVQYLVEQASVNDIAHGIAWAYSDDIFQRVTSGYLWQLIRYSWLLLLVPIVYELTIIKRSLLKFPEEIIRLLWLVAIFIIVILIIPRANGRIDINFLSRPGLVSIGLVMTTLPFILKPWMKGSVSLGMVVLGMVFLFGLMGNQESQIRKAWSVMRTALVVPLEVSSNSSTSLSNIGFASQIAASQLDRQLALKEVIDEILDPSETFFDATNNSADYGFQGRRCPVIDCAPYNAPSESQQRRMIQQIETQEIPLVLLSTGTNIFDGGPLSLRNYWLYLYLVEKFDPFVDTNGYIWMIRKGEESRLESTPFRIEAEEKSGLLMTALWQGNLAGLPKSWGESFQSLESRLTNSLDLLSVSEIATVGIDHVQGNVFNKIEPEGCLMMEVPRDEQGDMLYIDTDVAVDGSQLKVYWTNNKASDYTDYNRFSFDAGSDQYLVPLSSAPDWLLVDSDKTLHICFPAEMMGEFSFQQITLYDRLMTD